MKLKIFLLSIFLSFSISGTAYAKTSVEDLLQYEPDVQEITVDYTDKSIEVHNEDSTLKKELGISNASSARQIQNALDEAGYTEIDVDGSAITYRNRFENKRLIVKGNPASDVIDKAVFNGWTILQYESVDETIEAYEALKAKGYMVFPDEPVKVEANMSKTSSQVENAGAVELGLDEMQTIGTNQVTVAVVDTGFTDSEFFEDRMLDTLNFSNEPDTTDTWDDGFGHGTGVASVIVDATGDSVKVLPMKVTGADGTGVQLSFIAAFEHIFENADVDVINFCLGWQCSTSDNAAACTFWTDVIEKAVNEYHIPVVVASGNQGTKDTCYPANLDAVWSVGSLGDEVEAAASDSDVGDMDDDEGVSDDSDGETVIDYNVLSSFSNYGNIDFVARGFEVPIVNGQGMSVTESGTSVSAPLISSMAANFKTRYNYATCEALYDVMKSLCEDLGEEGYDEYYGWGRPVYVSGSGHTCPDGCDFVEASRTEATCVEEGEVVSYCSRCGLEHKEVLEIDESAHTGYTFSFTDATCTVPSYKVKTCKSCKAEISRLEYSDALGHHYDSQSTYEEDSEDGKEVITYHTAHCDRCDETFKSELSRRPKTTESDTEEDTEDDTREDTEEETTAQSPARPSTSEPTQSRPGSVKPAVTEKTTEKSTEKATEKTTERTTEVSKPKVVYPKTPAGVSVKNKSKKKMTISCKAQKGVKYLYQYSTSKKFKKASTKKSGSRKVTVSVKKGRKYYVRVRTYKTINHKTVRSPWSKVKTIKIKK